MIRILIVDDQKSPEFIPAMARELEGGYRQDVQTHHLNPTPYFAGVNVETETGNLMNEVRLRAAEFWDVAIIDVNLYDVGIDQKKKLHLSLLIADAFRKINRSAVVMLYSGTLEKHVAELLDAEELAESALKRIYQVGIANFVPRNQIANEVYSAVNHPPLLLEVDRMLMKEPSFRVAVEESEFTGKTFGDLAAAVRHQDTLGRRVCSLVSQFGVASILDLNR